MSIKDFLKIFPVYLNPPELFEFFLMQNSIFRTSPELRTLLSLYGHPADGGGGCSVHDDYACTELCISYPSDYHRYNIFTLTIKSPTHTNNKYIDRKKILMNGKFEGIIASKVVFPSYLAIHDILARKNCLTIKLELK